MTTEAPESGRSWRSIRRAALIFAVAVAAFTAVVALDQSGVWPDSRLPADETARQLRSELDVEWTFSCTRAENDHGILPADIDYYCDPSRREEVGYWVDTDRTSIEIVGRTG